MEKIALPQKIDFKKGENPNEGIISISPCYPGYGITLGNSLRRVLLSSLPGAAVVGVKIRGASHEFMALPHVKEDVLQIILNLKKLRLQVHTDEIVKLEVNGHGIKTLKAKDIEANSNVTIINPELELANITDVAGDLQMEIFVSTGRGYETAENREKDSKEVDYIEIDSIFTPILKASVKIENIRIGKMTNWEKLILNILTDGSIEPEMAFNDSVDILIEQFKALTKTDKRNKKKEEKANEKEGGKIEKKTVSASKKRGKTPAEEKEKSSKKKTASPTGQAGKEK